MDTMIRPHDVLGDNGSPCRCDACREERARLVAEQPSVKEMIDVDDS